MSGFAGTVLLNASCPSESINSDSVHFLSISIWKIDYVVVLLISVLFSAIWASSGMKEAGGYVVKLELLLLTLLGSDVFNIWV